MTSRKPKCSVAPVNQRGFTLLELLTVIAILAVLAVIGVPSFSDMIAKSRAIATATSLQLALVKARSEAVKRNASVSIVPNAGGWVAGWQLRDTGGNVIGVEDALRGVTVSTTATTVVYRPSGRIFGSAPSFEVTAANRTSVKRCVSAELSGRPYVAEGQC